VRWQSPDGKRVEKLRRRKQWWWTAPYFGYVLAAQEWGLRPSALGLCRPEDDLAVMVAFVDTRARMQAKEAQEQARKGGAKE
jgi:hypothetical protein